MITEDSPEGLTSRGQGEPSGEKTFRTKYSMMSKEQIREMEDWGRGKNGYTAIGNYDDNPDLKIFTIKKYAD